MARTPSQETPDPREAAHYLDTIERATLCALLRYPREWPKAASLSPADFGKGSHKIIFAAMQGGSCSYASVMQRLEQHGQYTAVAEDLLAAFNDPAGEDGFFGEWIPQLKAVALRRLLWHASEQLATLSLSTTLDTIAETRRVAEHLQTLAEAAEIEDEESPLYTLSEALQRPHAPPIWPGILNKGERLELYGESGSGKTFEGVHISSCFAYGEDWHDRKTLLTGSVLYIAAEDFEGVAMRYYGWLTSRHKPPTAVDGKLMLYDGAVNLRSDAAVQKAIARVQRAEFCPDLIIIDSFSLCFEGNDIDGHQNREAFQGIGKLQAAFPDANGLQATAIVINHMNKAGTSWYGHSSHKNFVTSMLQMSRERDSGIMTLRYEKTRNSALPADIALKLEPVKVDVVSGISTCILVPPSEADMAALMAAVHQREVEALEILAGLGAAGARSTDWEDAWCKQTSQSDTAFKAIKKQLDTAGLIHKGAGTRGLFSLSEEGVKFIREMGKQKGTSPSDPMEGKGNKGTLYIESSLIPLPDAFPKCPKCGAPEAHRTEADCERYYQQQGEQED